MGVLIFLAGACVGMAIMVFIRRSHRVGTLRIIHSDEEAQPYLACDLDKHIYEFQKKKYVVMRTKNENYVSHE